MSGRRKNTIAGFSEFLDHLQTDAHSSREIVHHETIPRSPAMTAPLNPPLPPILGTALRGEGIQRLYSHQVEAIQHTRSGRNVVTVTPTASGKTLNYLLPILEAILEDDSTHAILLFPIKALAQDQLKRIHDLTSQPGLTHIRAAIYDGDTPKSLRGKIRRDPPHLLLTNPDMLHQGLLPFHSNWADFLRTLRFIVIDELHGYKGIFGSHVLQIFYRLRRIAHYYGATPQFLAASATIANPGDLAKQLTGEPFEVVKKSGAPSAERHMFFVNPTASLYTATVKLMTDAIQAGLKTIVFTKARRITELIHRWVLQSNPDLAGAVSAYRSGYLPEERREIERNLQNGTLHGVIATSALEMGINIGGLDIAILVGYPGTIASTWQRGGRAGRKDRDSAIFLVALPDALDQYFMRHPADFFERDVEAAVVDATNPYIFHKHLVCAAQELPLRVDDPHYNATSLVPALQKLTEEGELLEAAKGRVYFSKLKQPQRNVNLRGDGTTVTITEASNERLIGRLSTWQAMTECHPGAVYLHHGDSYLVDRLDLGRQEAVTIKRDLSYYTQARTEKNTEILETWQSEAYERFKVSLGKLKVTERVIGYERRSSASREKISDHPLDLPPVTYETIGIWYEPPAEAIAGLLEEKRHPMGALHASEHACLAMLPLFAMCDRNDVGGISFTRHTSTGGAVVFLYDGHPGGVGLANRAYTVINDLFEKVYHLVHDCPCEDGCPSCIHSPKCGNGNQPLDKQGCIRLLEHLTGRAALDGDPELAYGAFGTSGTSQTRPLSSKAPTDIPQETASIYEDKRHFLRGKDVVVYDVETQLSAEDVGGWHNVHLMRLALGVIYDYKTDSYTTYYEDDAEEMVERLAKADLVVGYNHKRFDNVVLSIYSSRDMRELNNIDLLEEINDRNGFRVKLGDLGLATLNAPKSADGLQSLQWWKEGKIEEIERYCRMDVQITKELLDYALEHGELLVNRFDQGAVKLPLDLPVEKLLRT